jgi:hypothetical protein
MPASKLTFGKKSGMEKILESPWDFIFYREGERHFLSVLCGTTAVFEITIELNAEEMAEYQAKGLDYIRNLARGGQSEPGSWIKRRV